MRSKSKKGVFKGKKEETSPAVSSGQGRRLGRAEAFRVPFLCIFEV